jgi:hypothetical protein
MVKLDSELGRNAALHRRCSYFFNAKSGRSIGDRPRRSKTRSSTRLTCSADHAGSATQPACVTAPNADFALMRSPITMAMSSTRVRCRTSRGTGSRHVFETSGGCALAHRCRLSARDTLLLAAGGERHDRATPQTRIDRGQSPAAGHARAARAREGAYQSRAQAPQRAPTAEPLGAPAGGPARAGRTHPPRAGSSRSSRPC